MGLALVTGWTPDTIRSLTGPELQVLADHIRARKRAALRAQRKRGGR